MVNKDEYCESDRLICPSAEFRDCELQAGAPVCSEILKQFQFVHR